MIPLEADVLMVGVDTSHYDHFQRLVKGDLQSLHMGWNYVANPRNTFAEAIEYIGRRPTLDVVFITNQTGFSDADLRQGCAELAQALAAHEAKPWVVLDTHLQYLRHIFEIESVDVERPSIVMALCDRHNHKCNKERANAA